MINEEGLMNDEELRLLFHFTGFPSLQSHTLEKKEERGNNVLRHCAEGGRNDKAISN